ncbi:MAG: hypothetical protein EP326_05605 [Deltaproteobacteria bacterium]|nr:MAG: hypothetical protein EP326_05605 [Deltaproteobacteria bacterium]
MKKLMIGYFILGLISSPSFANIRSGLNTGPLAVQYIMSDPPLPKTHAKKGEHFGEVKPGFIYGSFTGNYENVTEKGYMSGPTMAGSYGHALSDKLSLFGWIVGSKIEGKARSDFQNSGLSFSQADDISVEFYNLSAGVSYLVYSSENKDSFVSVFGGAYIPIYRFSEKFINYDTNNPAEAEIEASHTFTGLLLGVQWQKQIHEKWGIGSFLILADTFGSNDFMNPFGDTGECRQFKVKRLISGSSNGVQEVDRECAGGDSNEFWFDTMIGGIGFTVEYKPWDLKTNLVSPFLNRYIFEIFYEEMEPEFIYLSVSFGI